MSLTNAFRKPIVIATLVLAVVAGLLVAWWLFPLGLAFAAVIALAIARDPAERLSESMKSAAPLAPRFQEPFDRLQRAQTRILSILAETDASGRSVETVQPALEELTSHVYASCQRMTRLDTLRNQAGAQAAQQLAQTEQKLNRSHDPLQQSAYQQTKQSLEARLQQVQAVSTQVDRFDAALNNVATSVEGEITGLVQLQARGADDVRAGATALASRLRDQAASLARFERDAGDLALFESEMPAGAS
ncbi:MAG: hypothetical protein U0822_26245 [Anaerolineae bacterium]